MVSGEDQLRTVSFPDVAPTDIPPGACPAPGGCLARPTAARPPALPAGTDFSMCAGDFVEVFGDSVDEWHCIATPFFLDTAKVHCPSLSRAREGIF